MKILVGMPAYNEGLVISGVIRRIRKAGYEDVLVVDDNSSDDTAKKARREGAKVISHAVNKGAGAATRTIIGYARKNGYDFVVLMDSDGQHDPRDIKKFLQHKDKDVVLGYRHFGAGPFSRKAYNVIGNGVTWLFFGLRVKDSQSGFKMLGKKAMRKIVITQDRFEFCSEMIGEIKKKRLSYAQVPIRTIYTDYSLSKGQNFANGCKMLWRLTKRKLR